MKQVGLFCVALFLAVSNANAEQITIVGDPWCPYNCEPGSNKQGFMIETAQQIFKEKGIDVVYKVVPWSRAIDSTRNGDYNAIVGAYKDDAPDFIFPETSMAQSNDGFYAKKDSSLSWTYKDIPSLEMVSVGFINDYSYGDVLDNYIAKHKADITKVQFASGDKALEQNVKKLMAGRIQVVIEDRAVMQYFLSTTGKSYQLKEVGKHEGDPVYIAFSPKNPRSKDYAKILSDGVKQYQASGKLRAIKAEYGVK